MTAETWSRVEVGDGGSAGWDYSWRGREVVGQWVDEITSWQDAWAERRYQKAWSELVTKAADRGVLEEVIRAMAEGRVAVKQRTEGLHIVYTWQVYTGDEGGVHGR